MSSITNSSFSGLGGIRIAFMGTPDFAVASLEALVNAGCNIVGVVTAPDKPAGRGMKLTESAVKKYAVQKDLNVLQPEKLKSPDFLEKLRQLNADVQVVVAFRMLPEVVWNMPPLGTINLHGSLLPHYRGAAPINWAIINGEKETGVTTFKLKHEIDTGNILLREKIKIGEYETAGELHDRMKSIGAQLLVKTIDALADGKAIEQDQSSMDNELTDLKHAPKIYSETCNIDWNNAVSQVYNLVRGLSPYPAASTKINGKILKIYKCTKDTTIVNEVPGSVTTDHKQYIKIACNDGYISVLELQVEGKKRMMVEDYLRGNKI